ncbi:hypothetical protein BG004_000610 [Podila humilis]|nr:hypothetical protein BG004_000610 [Podila humilis]
MVDPLAATGAQTVYASGMTDSAQGDIVSEQRLEEQFAMQSSELYFRSALLAQYAAIQKADDFDGESVCSTIGGIVRPLVTKVKEIVAQLGETLGLGPIGIMINFALTNIESITQGGIVGQLALSLALIALKTAIAPVLAIPGLSLLAGPLDALLRAVDDVAKCVATKNEVIIDTAYCSYVADMYRLATKAAVDVSPASNLDQMNASEELRRLVTGSRVLLDMMSKYSVASKNEDLLNFRPIFAANVLEEFRNELLHIEGEVVDATVTRYVKMELAAVIAVSNSLEACLRVAVDPSVAVEELNEDIDDFEEDYDEEDDLGSEEDLQDKSGEQQ